MLPGPNFAVIENSSFGDVEGTVFKLSNLSFAYLHRFSHFIRFCPHLYREAERKINAGLYVGERSSGFEIRPKAEGTGRKFGRVYFSTLLLYFFW
jgi:hypothetical protein